MKTKKRIIILIVALILVIGGVILARYLISVSQYQDKVSSITYVVTDLSGIPDGTYTGECDVGFIYAKVSVQVQEEQITGIQLLEHDNGRGSSAEGIEKRIVAEQKVDVDAVSGATNSSKVIKKAVDNALASAN